MPPRRGVARRGRGSGVQAPPPALEPAFEPQEFGVPLGDSVTVGSMPAEAEVAADSVPVESGRWVNQCQSGHQQLSQYQVLQTRVQC